MTIKDNASILRGKDGGLNLVKQNLNREQTNVISTTAVNQASVYAQTWLAGLITGAWEGGNTWLCAEWGTGTIPPGTPPVECETPVLRKLVDSVEFVLPDGVTVSNGPTPLVLVNISLQTTDANGNTITEYAIFGGAPNLNTEPYGSGICILYGVITPGIVKTSSITLPIPVLINV